MGMGGCPEVRFRSEMSLESLKHDRCVVKTITRIDRGGEGAPVPHLLIMEPIDYET